MDLIHSIKVKITYAHWTALQAIDMHDFSHVKRKVAQEHPEFADPEYLDGGITYLKRYYALHILDPLNPPAMSKPIDPFWHSHVLYSEDYIAFCDYIFGQYIHHVPLLLNDKMAVAFVKDMYDHTYMRHSQIFGKPDETYFPKNALSPQGGGGVCCSPTAALRLAKFLDVALFPEDKLLKLDPQRFKTGKKS